MVGSLLRHARISSGRSQVEMAAALHVPKYRYAQWEQGKQDLSMAELTSAAELCGVSLRYFFDDAVRVEEQVQEAALVVTARVKHKLTGALLRQARVSAGLSQKACAERLGITSRRLVQYETGQVEIPEGQLEMMGHKLGLAGVWQSV